MRIPIREQLALIFLLSSLVCLGVVSIATWVTNHHFVLKIRSTRLGVVASLKAAQLTSNLNLMQTTAGFVSTRIVIQQALEQYNIDGNNTEANWADAQTDMVAALSGSSLGQALLFQTIIFPKNAEGPAGKYGLLNTTSAAVEGKIALPYDCSDGSSATLGMESGVCGGYGYPPNLYPNLTYSTVSNVQHAEYNGHVLGPGPNSGLLIGPWEVNQTFSLVSLTIPLVNNTSASDVLGWLTVVMDARLISDVLVNAEGLGKTGETLLVGPVSKTNLFQPDVKYQSNDRHPQGDVLVHYVTYLNSSYSSRHPGRTLQSSNKPFRASQYPALLEGISTNTGQLDNAGAKVKGRNEAGKKVSTGWAIPQTNLVDWLILMEQAQSEVWQPINHLRDILVACVFGTLGFMIIIIYPLAHFFSLPIRRLREATAKSVEPPGYSASRSSIGSFGSSGQRTADDSGGAETADGAVIANNEKASANPVSKWRKKRKEDREARRERRRREAFRIPGKVKERKNYVKDELSDLTRTFNEMSDELMMQYTKLEERVQERTAELEQSKKAAEAANESKTLFIANISHELKTPLNGILGMCAVCMQEEDATRLKRSLGVIYKSGDLLLNLLTDLLTFSKNQVGNQHLSLDEKEFRLRDVSSQILAIFEKQAMEGQIDLRVEWQGVDNLPSDNSSPERMEYGPNGTGRLKDMIMWGDLQRILQVVINLVSNSLKFTPPGGSVVLTIRCLAEPYESNSRKGSSASRQSRQSRQSRGLSSRNRASESAPSLTKTDAAVAKDKPNALANVYVHERASSPPPGVYIYFEFEVTDTGPGIQENLQHKIFEPFVQGDLGLSKKYGGTGLGLSICSQLASLMRGSIGVRSTLGVGSTFTMKIPLRHLKTRADSSASSGVDIPHSAQDLHRSASLEDGERTPARHSRHLADDTVEEKASINTGPASASSLAIDSQPRLVGLSQPFFASSQPMESPGSQPAAMEQMAAEAKRSGHKIRVLVAEDNPVNQEVVLRMLKLEDIYDVTVAKDGQEALDLVKASMNHGGSSDSSEVRHPFDLIFMDVQMPNVNGLESTKMIRKIGYQAPIVALTAFAEESNIKDCLESGMNYFLSKPIRRPQLKKVLKEYCAPIPEENEDAPPTEPEVVLEPNTTVVVINKDVSDDPPQSQLEVGRSENAPFTPESNRNAEDDLGPESPISPLTKA